MILKELFIRMLHVFLGALSLPRLCQSCPRPPAAAVKLPGEYRSKMTIPVGTDYGPRTANHGGEGAGGEGSNRIILVRKPRRTSETKHMWAWLWSGTLEAFDCRFGIYASNRGGYSLGPWNGEQQVIGCVPLIESWGH